MRDISLESFRTLICRWGKGGKGRGKTRKGEKSELGEKVEEGEKVVEGEKVEEGEKG